MEGIIVSDFELTIKKLNQMIKDLESNIADLNAGVYDLSKLIKYTDLKFLTSKMDSELDYLKNVILKTEAYHNTLINVLKSYEEQSINLTNNIKKLAS